MQNLILGIVQGITEFLPISSSAHLIILSHFLFKEEISLTSVVCFHAGTLLALLLYFGKDWLNLVKGGFSLTKKGDFFELSERKIFWLIVIATLPAAILGKLFAKKVEDFFYTPLSVALNMGGFAVLFYIIEKKSRQNKIILELSIFQAFFIGIMQALAVMPGISRAGITIASGLLMGMNREDAVKFSFLLSLPIILGALVLKLPSIINNFSLSSQYGLAFVSSFISGALAIGFLTRFVRNHSFKIFISYRILFSILIIIKVLV